MALLASHAMVSPGCTILYSDQCIHSETSAAAVHLMVPGKSTRPGPFFSFQPSAIILLPLPLLIPPCPARFESFCLMEYLQSVATRLSKVVAVRKKCPLAEIRASDSRQGLGSSSNLECLSLGTSISVANSLGHSEAATTSRCFRHCPVRRP